MGVRDGDKRTVMRRDDLVCMPDSRQVRHNVSTGKSKRMNDGARNTRAM